MRRLRYIPVSNLAKITQSSFTLSQKAEKLSRSPSLKGQNLNLIPSQSNQVTHFNQDAGSNNMNSKIQYEKYFTIYLYIYIMNG